MKVYLPVLFFCFAFSRTSPLEESREAVPPQYLDQLLNEERYDEFNRLLGIDIPHLSRPRNGNETHHPRFSPYLEHGDILLTPKQKAEARQGTAHADLMWDTYYIPYYISSKYREKHYTCFELGGNFKNIKEKTIPALSQRKIILDGVERLNTHCGGCIRFVRRSDEKDYIFIYPGNGCFSNLGKTGGQQPLSLDQNGCLDQATVIHECMHALAIHHEQNRPDRDNFIKMLWKNIEKDWQSQFYKESSEDVIAYGPYDCYSVMHYPVSHPDVSKNKPCFEIYDKSIDPSIVGYAEDATETDAEKLQDMYCYA